MIKRWLLAFAFLAVATPGWAQNPTCPTRSEGDSSNACASTAFVNNEIAHDARPKLNANLTLYYHTGGTSTTCLGETIALACASPQLAVTAAYKYDRNSYTITIQPSSAISSGTFGAVTFDGAFVGTGSTVLKGICTSSSTWKDIKLSTTNESSIVVKNYAVATVECLQPITATSGSGINASTYGKVLYNRIDFGVIAGSAFDSSEFGYIEASATDVGSKNIRLSGNTGAAIWHINETGEHFADGLTVTCSGITQVGSDTAAVAGFFYIPNMTASGCGAVTNVGAGKRYFVHNWARIQTGSNGNPTYFFGSNAGTTNYGGFYDYEFAPDDGWRVACSGAISCPLYVYGSLGQLGIANPGATNSFSVANTGTTANTVSQFILNTGTNRQAFFNLIEDGAGSAALTIGTNVNANGGIDLHTYGANAPINFNTGATFRWQIGGGSGHLLPATTLTYDIGGTSNRVSSLYVASINITGQLTSTLATGVAPFVVASATLVPNLYVARAQVADSASLVVGITTITSGTNTRILYNNSGVLGEYTLTGSGTVAVMQNTPTLTTPVLGVATGTSLALNGCTISANNLCTTGTALFGGAVSVTDTTDASSTTTGAIKSSGGISAQKTIYAKTGLYINDNTNALRVINVTNSNTGASAGAGLQLQSGTANSTFTLYLYDNTASPYGQWQIGTAVTAFYWDVPATAGVRIRKNSDFSTMVDITSSGLDSKLGILANGSAGLSVTTTVRDAAGVGTCTLVFTYGIKTGGTC